MSERETWAVTWSGSTEEGADGLAEHLNSYSLFPDTDFRPVRIPPPTELAALDRDRERLDWLHDNIDAVGDRVEMESGIESIDLASLRAGIDKIMESRGE